MINSSCDNFEENKDAILWRLRETKNGMVFSIVEIFNLEVLLLIGCRGTVSSRFKQGRGGGLEI